jgi:Phosphodiester glycosidase
VIGEADGTPGDLAGSSILHGRLVSEAVDGRERVVALREPRGGAIPAGGSVLTGTGDAADWLRAHARPGSRVRLRTQLRGERGRLPLGPGLGILNGGPRLLRDGRADVTAEAEGFDHPDDPGFYYAFGLRRNPRTMAGVTRDGRLLVVAVDGRAPEYSAGLSFEEEAAVMRALGAREAVNLDGGGSTTMTVRGNVVTRPSDATGERPIADAIVVRPHDRHAALTPR